MSYDPSPSDTIYYHEFPYRACIGKKSVAHASRQYKMAYKNSLYNELNDFFMNSPNKSRVRYNGFNVYFQDYDLFVETLHMFSELLDACYGPVSAEHLSMLMDKRFSLDVRSRYYYYKYDTKLSIYTTYFRIGNLGNVKKRSREINEFIRDQFGDSIRIQQQWSLGTELYVNYADWDEIEPFFRIQFPNTKVKITRCFLYDK